ncbi:MAG: hypothetical protein Q9184_002387 [Pyrenodesmia sp. 2 TL-2023]
MELPQMVDPLPVLPDFCFDLKQSGKIRLESGSTITTLDKGDTVDLIKRACDDTKYGSLERHKETKNANPNTRIVVAAEVAKVANVKWDKEQCNARFTQLLNDCPNYGGSVPVEGVTYTLIAVTIPQKDPPPKPPLSDTALAKYNRCFKTEDPPSLPDNLENGGRLTKVDPNRKRLDDMIYEGCTYAKDSREFAIYDDSKKGSDNIPVRLNVRAQHWDPTDPDRKDPKALFMVVRGTSETCSMPYTPMSDPVKEFDQGWPPGKTNRDAWQGGRSVA